MTSFVAALPAALDQPDHPIGMGVLFVLIIAAFAVIFLAMVMIGHARDQKRGPRGPFEGPVLFDSEDRKKHRQEHGRRH